MKGEPNASLSVYLSVRVKFHETYSYHYIRNFY
jgi:hypothetical protein